MEKKQQEAQKPSKFPRAKNPNFFNCELDVKVAAPKDAEYDQIDLSARHKLVFEKLEPTFPLKQIEALLPKKIAQKLHQIEELLVGGDAKTAVSVLKQI